MNILLSLTICIAGIVAGYLAARFIQKRKTGEYEVIGRKILEDARKESDVVKREASIQAKDIVIQARNELEQECKEQKRPSFRTRKDDCPRKRRTLIRKWRPSTEREDEALGKKEKQVGSREVYLEGRIGETELVLKAAAGEAGRDSRGDVRGCEENAHAGDGR